jgi:MFS family permease
VLVIPFSAVGPLAGVLIDRWSRRRILAVTPAIRMVAAAALLALSGRGISVYAFALVVVSLNRFYLATAGAVTPLLVPAEDLLIGNSLASVGGTVLTFAGVIAGTKLADPIGTRGLLLVTAATWPLAAILVRGIGDPLRATRPRPDARLSADLARIPRELWTGLRRLVATPPAFGAIVSISLDQFLVGVVTVLSLVVFKEQFREGVGSYGNILAAGGVGVLAGTLSVGWLEPRLSRARIVAVGFALAGVTCLAVASAVTGPTILLVSFALGLTFAWRKIPVDTIVQEAVPDRFRGRVFALYDLGYSMARVLAALAAVPLIPRLSTGWLLALTGAVYVLWTPALPWWVRRPRWVAVRFYAGGRADEVPRAIVVGGEEEPVEPLGSWIEDRDGVPLRRLRVRSPNGTLDLQSGPRERWRIVPRSSRPA